MYVFKVFVVTFISIAVTSIVIYYCHVYIHRRYQHCYLLLSRLYPSPLPALLFIIVMFISIAVTNIVTIISIAVTSIVIYYIHRRYQILL